MIKELIKLANDLDERGLQKEADALDKMIRVAAEQDDMIAQHSFNQWAEERDKSPQPSAEEMREEINKELFPFVNLLLNADLEGNKYEGTPEEQTAAVSFLETISDEDLEAVMRVANLLHDGIKPDSDESAEPDEGWAVATNDVAAQHAFNQWVEEKE